MRCEQRLMGLLAPILATALMALAGCTDDGFSDLDAFMAEKRAKPGGKIEPIPTFKAYDPFAYSATTLRGPLIARLIFASWRHCQRKPLRPDNNRAKEYLERFTLIRF